MYQPLTTGPSPRIAAMAAASAGRTSAQPESPVPLLLHEGWVSLGAEHPQWPSSRRAAGAMAWAIANQPAVLGVFPGERLVGIAYHGRAITQEQPDCAMTAFWSAFRAQKESTPFSTALVDMGVLYGSTIFGHIAWNWEQILQKGVLAMISEHRGRLERAAEPGPRQYHTCAIEALEALLAWNDAHVAALETTRAGAGGEEADRLDKLITLCRRVPAYPARTFYEAVQAFYLPYLAVITENPYGGNGPGRMDYLLWPYLAEDLAAGRTTLQDARELVDELFLRMHERLLEWDTWVESAMVGGCHSDGSSAVSPLSYIMVESMMGLGVTHPSVYVRIPPRGCPEDFLELTALYMKNGRNRAQMLCDRAILASQTRYGMDYADAARYICGGCMEINPQGMNSDLLFSDVLHIAKIGELAVTGGRCLITGKQLPGDTPLKPLPEYRDFEELYSAFEWLLCEVTALYGRNQDTASRLIHEYRPAYLLSTMVDDCPRTGKALHEGGARYHDCGASTLAIANAADSFFALAQAVYEQRFVSAQQMLDALHRDFAGVEPLRQRLQALPRYGRQHPGADAMAARVLGSVYKAFAGPRTRFGGRLKPIPLTFTWAASAGAALGARAYGEHAGRVIAHGVTPASAAMTEGITAAMGSLASLDLTLVPGGASTMWDLDSAWATPERIRWLLESFVDGGGHIFQGNMTDVEELVCARRDPDAYRHLIVRVGGYSARFTALEPALQDEIIRRRRHGG